MQRPSASALFYQSIIVKSGPSSLLWLLERWPPWIPKMPGKVRVKIIAGRNLPVMDRSNETADAFVEIKLANITYKTDVYRKSLNPQWNTDFYRFELDDAELQDEPLQIRLMDHDTYTANDAIGKVSISLNPLLLPHMTSGQTTVSEKGKKYHWMLVIYCFVVFSSMWPNYKDWMNARDCLVCFGCVGCWQVFACGLKINNFKCHRIYRIAVVVSLIHTIFHISKLLSPLGDIICLFRWFGCDLSIWGDLVGICYQRDKHLGGILSEPSDHYIFLICIQNRKC